MRIHINNIKNIYLFISLLAVLNIECTQSKLNAQSVIEDAKMQYYLEKVQDRSIDIGRKLPIFDTIIKFYQAKGKSSEARKYLFEKIKILNRASSYLEAHNACLNVIDAIESSGIISATDSSQLAEARLLLAKSCIYLGMFDESISQLLDLLKQQDRETLTETYSYLGYVFMITEQMEQSRKFNFKALTNLIIENPEKVPEKASTVYNNYAGYYYTGKQFDSALYFLNLSAKYHQATQNFSQQVHVYHNMSIIYQQMGEYEIGKDYLLKAITLSEEIKLPYTQTVCLQNLAYLFYGNDEYEKALNYYTQALQLAQKTKIPKIESSILMEISDVCYALGRYKEAMKYKKQGVQLRDSVFNGTNIERIAALSQQFDLYKIKTEKQLLSKQLLLSRLISSKKNIHLGILIGLLILLTIITLVVTRHIKRQSKQSQVLEDKLAHIQKEDKDKRQCVTEKYEPIIEQKNRELTANALFLVKVNEMLNSLKKNVNQQLNTKDAMSRAQLNKEMATILKSYNPEKGWQEFKLYFEQIHHSFYTRINEINPELSQIEQRLCALLALNMTTKEIADLTNRSTRTIETIIYKIRKKLNIPAEEKTLTFLRRFC